MQIFFWVLTFLIASLGCVNSEDLKTVIYPNLGPLELVCACVGGYFEYLDVQKCILLLLFIVACLGLKFKINFL